MSAQVVQAQVMCELCGGPHPFDQCQAALDSNNVPLDQAQVQAVEPTTTISTTISAAYDSSSTTSIKLSAPRPPAPAEKPSELQAALLTLTNTQTRFMTETRSSIRNLEMQVGQLANMLNTRPQGNFPSNTMVNPKEQCQAITLRSRKEIEGSSLKGTQEKKAEEEGSCEKVEPQVEKKVTEGLATKEKIQLLHINIPFAEALEKMSSYVKFMKEILLKKQRLEDFETVALTEECNAILQRKLPQKLQDPGSFTIPCSIGKFECKNMLFKLGLGEAKPTTITLLLADRSIKHRRGVIEDVLVKVDKFIFPADFIVLEMEEDANIPIILGRPFLAIGKAQIDVQKGELKLRVQNEEVTFNVFSAIDIPTCYRVDVVCNGGSNLETTKRKTNAEIGSRVVHHCLKQFYSGKAPMISNIKR
ncbi:uncharacterized protein LOC133806853 [Humulus lupulus]|uniref:uncharacterized protein LOC133806853 n=1 Tax=Humulus lupulus TaxID=3486 RepID=UPI002B41502E|nr:uncharacterized protein LOC133806853 [Humulus lupulus]